jgi:hypothetical protein
MVVRSAQKSRDDIQKVREAMESRKPVLHDSQRELIIKQANIIGEDGVALIQDIEDAAQKTGAVPADIFKLIESCMASLSQRVRIQMQSDEVTRQKEPERLKQMEAIREHATMLFGSQLNGDKPSVESVAKAMRELVTEYMAAVDQDKEDGLDPETARLWKQQVQEIVAQANLDPPATNAGRSEPAAASQAEAAAPRAEAAAPRAEVLDCLATLKNAIDQARYTAEAAAREMTVPEETVLRGFGKQLGSSRKEIMALSKGLVVGQPAGVALEATRLADEACDAIKTSREAIRTALRELGAASNISEASGPTRARPQPQERLAMGRLDPVNYQLTVPAWSQCPPPPPEWAVGAQPMASTWSQRPPPPQGPPWAWQSLGGLQCIHRLPRHGPPWSPCQDPG